MEVDSSRLNCCPLGCLSTHDLTWRSTARYDCRLYRCQLSTHDLTWRSTGRALRFLIPLCSFNSRPHMEVDSRARRSCTGGNSLSTHDLTWRSTNDRSRNGVLCSLSTHDLTWRSTIFFFLFTVCQLYFQLTTSHGGRLSARAVALAFLPFNSRPHMEVDRLLLIYERGGGPFNSRPHMEVDGKFLYFFTTFTDLLSFYT